jgi:hypothetical protein
MVRKQVDFDPAVAAVLGDGERREEERHLSVAKRKQRARDRERDKLTVDLPPEVIARVREIAGREDTGVSSLVHWLLVEGLRAYEEVERLRKEAARSLRYSYDVVVEDRDVV